MEVEIFNSPGSAAAKISLADKEKLITEGGAMIAMIGDIAVQTTTEQRSSGGFLAGLKRMIGGESYFLNHYTAKGPGASVFVAPPLPGDITVVDLNGVGIVVESGAFVATSSQVDMSIGWQGFKNLFSGESLFWLNFAGKGKVILASFGAVYTVEVDGEYIVDTGHIVAFEETLEFSLSKASTSWLQAYFSGEGIVCRFKGKGRVWCQSHQSHSFGMAFGSLLTPR